ncbi:hypothetical protein KIW84_013892 [Lathyrus oleraceus]|uniref:Neprosin PEP catalytic domain-containing protein n=3 Tax=Pisum sativum TaxID=3888 RepID=A0A9D5BLL7_PEA|nr:hypothetical protein KIW84_013892 [Pisum sativum]
MINMMFLLILFSTTVISHRVDDSDITLKEDFELEKHLKLINKPPIKSIHTEFGYIVDCVDIKKQPAFDHPLLKNHKLQTRPSFYSKIEDRGVNISSTKTSFELNKVNCPKGFVPIRRTTKEDLKRTKSFLNYNILATATTHKAEVFLKYITGDNYYGIMGTTSVYNPRCSIAQASSSNIYVRNGEGGTFNQILVGWHSDGFVRTGCYNLQCRGFVQIHSQYHIGAVVSKTSVYGGDMVEMPISIVQDERSKNWWITINGKAVGYYPQALFNNLKTANQVGWGGATIAVGAPSPQMGSGSFPDRNFEHACYFKNIGYKNETNSPYYGPDQYAAHIYHDAPECFGVDYYGKQKSPYGYSLQFGGPGGRCGGYF